MADEGKRPAVPTRDALDRVYRATQYVERLPRTEVPKGASRMVADGPRLAKSTDTITAAVGDTCGFGHADLYYHNQTEGSRALVADSPAVNVEVLNPWPKAINSGKRLIVRVIAGKWTLMEADCS